MSLNELLFVAWPMRRPGRRTLHSQREKFGHRPLVPPGRLLVHAHRQSAIHPKRPQRISAILQAEDGKVQTALTESRAAPTGRDGSPRRTFARAGCMGRALALQHATCPRPATAVRLSLPALPFSFCKLVNSPIEIHLKQFQTSNPIQYAYVYERNVGSWCCCRAGCGRWCQSRCPPP